MARQCWLESAPRVKGCILRLQGAPKGAGCQGPEQLDLGVPGVFNTRIVGLIQHLGLGIAGLAPHLKLGEGGEDGFHKLFKCPRRVHVVGVEGEEVGEGEVEGGAVPGVEGIAQERKVSAPPNS